MTDRLLAWLARRQARTAIGPAALDGEKARWTNRAARWRFPGTSRQRPWRRSRSSAPAIACDMASTRPLSGTGRVAGPAAGRGRQHRPRRHRERSGGRGLGENCGMSGGKNEWTAAAQKAIDFGVAAQNAMAAGDRGALRPDRPVVLGILGVRAPVRQGCRTAGAATAYEQALSYMKQSRRTTRSRSWRWSCLSPVPGDLRDNASCKHRDKLLERWQGRSPR